MQRDGVHFIHFTHSEYLAEPWGGVTAILRFHRQIQIYPWFLEGDIFGICNKIEGIGCVICHKIRKGRGESAGRPSRDDRELSFRRDRHGHEVDFLIGDEVGIEVKASSLVSGKHLKGLRMLSEEVRLKHKLVVSLDPRPRMVDDIEILPYREFISRLWGGGFA